jgi:hypothetical protein
MKFSCIDVFSGTGGIPFALRDFCDTILYCELHPYCQQVLVERMREAKLDKAPIHTNISNLHISPHVLPRMIAGGFPCTDISAIGLQQGITEDTRSGLFHEIMRIIDECPSIQVVFLENVANILRCGMQEVVNELRKRGFNFQWTTRSASMFGAPHVRTRWFCLAVRGNIDEYITSFSNSGLLEHVDTSHIWQDPKDIPPVVFKPNVKIDNNYDENWSLRCQCLGNAVVPCVVRTSLVEMLRSYKKWDNICACLGDSCQDVDLIGYPFSESGLVHNGHYYNIPKAILNTKKHNISINVLASGKEVPMLHLPTPRRGLTHASTLTDRSMRDLPTVILNSNITNDYLKANNITIEGPYHHSLYANVHFIEWMMGYEKDWTKVSSYTTKSFRNKSNPPISNGEDQFDTNGETEEESMGLQNENELSRESSKMITKTTKKKSLNGMHLFMRENPGKAITEISGLWKQLPQSARDAFCQAAKEERAKLL